MSSYAFPLSVFQRKAERELEDMAGQERYVGWCSERKPNHAASSLVFFPSEELSFPFGCLRDGTGHVHTRSRRKGPVFYFTVNYLIIIIASFFSG